MKRQKQVIRRKFNPNCQKDAPTVWYITKDGTLSQDEKEAVNKIRRTRKFNLDTANNRYVEVR
jgi:predicted N-acetyltransferase YhbS